MLYSLQGSGHGNLVFVNHMSNRTKFYYSVSFVRQYIDNGNVNNEYRTECSCILHKTCYYVNASSVAVGDSLFACWHFCSYLFAFNQRFQNILLGILSECQKDWIQIRLDILSGLI